MYDILLAFILAVLRILAAIVLSAGALYTGIGLLDRLTAGIDEWKEIKKGNLAVGLFYAAVMVALIILTAPRISEFVGYINLQKNIFGDLLWGQMLLFLVFSFINYLIALFAAVDIVFLTIHIVDRLTHDLDEMKELQKGNTAVSLIMSVVLLAVAFMAAFPLETLFTTIRHLESLLL